MSNTQDTNSASTNESTIGYVSSSYPDPRTHDVRRVTHRVSKRTHQVRFENETEDSVTVIIEPKE